MQTEALAEETAARAALTSEESSCQSSLPSLSCRAAGMASLSQKVDDRGYNVSSGVIPTGWGQWAGKA